MGAQPSLGFDDTKGFEDCFNQALGGEEAMLIFMTSDVFGPMELGVN